MPRATQTPLLITRHKTGASTRRGVLPGSHARLFYVIAWLFIRSIAILCDSMTTVEPSIITAETLDDYRAVYGWLPRSHRSLPQSHRMTTAEPSITTAESWYDYRVPTCLTYPLPQACQLVLLTLCLVARLMACADFGAYSCPTSLDKYNPLGCAFSDSCPTSLDKYNPLDCAFSGLCRDAPGLPWACRRVRVIRIKVVTGLSWHQKDSCHDFRANFQIIS